MPITAGSGDSGPVYCDTYSAITASSSKSDFDIATRSKRAPHRVQYVDYFFQREPAVLQIDTFFPAEIEQKKKKKRGHTFCF